MTTKPNDVRVISDAQPADQQGERIDQLKARCDELENLLLDLVTQHDLPIAARNLCNAALSNPADQQAETERLRVRCDELEHRASDVVEGFDGEQLPGAMTMRIRKLKAALSKPSW